MGYEDASPVSSPAGAKAFSHGVHPVESSTPMIPALEPRPALSKHSLLPFFRTWNFRAAASGLESCVPALRRLFPAVHWHLAIGNWQLALGTWHFRAAARQGCQHLAASARSNESLKSSCTTHRRKTSRPFFPPIGSRPRPSRAERKQSPLHRSKNSKTSRKNARGALLSAYCFPLPHCNYSKVGYFTPHCMAKAGALRLLASKASSTSRLYWAV